MLPAKEVAPGLWVGSVVDSIDPTFAKMHDIRLVVNCASGSIPSPFPRTIKLPLTDGPESRTKLAQLLPKTVEEVTKHRLAGHAVLIHCMAGVSRSATVAAAVLMKERGFTARRAVTEIQKKKPETFGTKGPDGQPVFFPVLRWWQRQI